MSSVFLQSTEADPFARYAARRSAGPVWWDAANRLWVVDSYAGCQQILRSPAALIPAPDHAALGATARAVAARLVRLSNPPRHTALRPLAERLFALLPSPEAAPALAELLAAAPARFDWVATVATRLPALVLLRGLGLAALAPELLAALPALTQLMLPAPTVAQAAAIDAAVATAWPLALQALQATPALAALLEQPDDLPELAANLLGLLIQSYDAGRGLLSHALLWRAHPAADGDWPRLLTEVLRFDPPIHTTRRVLAEPLEVAGVALPAGGPLLLVLAAANRDPAQFAAPDQFDPARPNNAAHLTFGLGAHACLARHWILALAAAALEYLATAQPALCLEATPLTWAPLANARLSETLWLAREGR